MMQSDKGWQERMRLLKPNVWLIHLGVNDERAKLPAAEVAATLSAMVDILRTEYGADPANIYVATPSYDYAPGAAEILAAYAQEIGRLIAEKGLRRGPDFFTAYEGKKAEYYGNDPVHPNAAGVELMARLWAKALAARATRAGRSQARVSNRVVPAGPGLHVCHVRGARLDRQRRHRGAA